MSLKLNQVIALVGGRKTRIQKLLTEVHHGWHVDRLTGMSKIYKPKDEEGEVFPPENRHVQLQVNQAIEDLLPSLIDFYDLVATQETGNTTATGDIIVEDQSIATDVPVTVLLFLEKQLVDLLTLSKKIPTLPNDKVWNLDEAKGCYVTKPEQTVKTQKRPEVIVKYEATVEHPAQTEIVTTDQTIGQWTTIHMSGAMPETKRAKIQQRITILVDAVKCAREQANSNEVDKCSYGKQILGYIFDK